MCAAYFLFPLVPTRNDKWIAVRFESRESQSHPFLKKFLDALGSHRSCLKTMLFILIFLFHDFSLEFRFLGFQFKRIGSNLIRASKYVNLKRRVELCVVGSPVSNKFR